MTGHGGLTNDLADWYPVVAATGVPTPKTVIIPVPDSLVDVFLDGTPIDPEGESAIQSVVTAVESFGAPVFLRTGHLSAKHSWENSCALVDTRRVTAHMSVLYDFQAMAFGIGMPQHIVVREMLSTEPLFWAFENMPITKERRYFVRDGKVYDHHPYWPIQSLEYSRPRNADGLVIPDLEWMSTIRQASVETAEEVDLLTAMSEQAAAGLDGAWSVDWLWTTDRGWVFIDAAHAEHSYVMSDLERETLDVHLDDLADAAVRRVAAELERNHAAIEARSRDMSPRAVRQRSDRYEYLRRQAMLRT